MRHAKVQDNLYDFINATLDAHLREEISQHLGQCERCAAEFEKMHKTLQSMPAGSWDPAAERPGMFWQQFAEKLERRIREQGQQSESSIVADLREYLRRHSRFAAGFASALALAAVAFFVWTLSGRVDTGPDMQSSSASSSIPVVNAALHARAYDYLDRSKVLLLGFVNVDMEDLQKQSREISREREISRQLARESSELSIALRDPSDRKLKDLVGDLEVILLQIANLDSHYDSPAVEMLKSGVDRKAILLKINLQEIERIGGGNVGAAKQSTSSNKETNEGERP